MIRITIVRFKLILASLVILTLASCYTEQSLGTRFVKKTVVDGPAVWFIGASYLFMNCNVPEDTSGYPCYLLESVNDSVFLENYNREFALQLEEYGYKVYTYNEADQFFTQTGVSLIINIAQLEVEEVLDFYTDSEVFDTLEYFETFPVRMLNINSWIEVSKVDSALAKREVFFGTNSVSDLIEGYFTQHPFRGDVSYTYKRYDMRPSLIDKFVMQTAKEHAGKLFDIWMNRYITLNSTESKKVGVYYQEKGYYHYNPEKRRIEIVDPSHALQKIQFN